jgi:hypothetical protein
MILNSDIVESYIELGSLMPLTEQRLTIAIVCVCLVCWLTVREPLKFILSQPLEINHHVWCTCALGIDELSVRYQCKGFVWVLLEPMR